MEPAPRGISGPCLLEQLQSPGSLKGSTQRQMEIYDHFCLPAVGSGM